MCPCPPRERSGAVSSLDNVLSRQEVSHEWVNVANNEKIAKLEEGSMTEHLTKSRERLEWKDEISTDASHKDN